MVKKYYIKGENDKETPLDATQVEVLKEVVIDNDNCCTVYRKVSKTTSLKKLDVLREEEE